MACPARDVVKQFYSARVRVLLLSGEHIALLGNSFSSYKNIRRIFFFLANDADDLTRNRRRGFFFYVLRATRFVSHVVVKLLMSHVHVRFQMFRITGRENKNENSGLGMIEYSRQ